MFQLLICLLLFLPINSFQCVRGISVRTSFAICAGALGKSRRGREAGLTVHPGLKDDLGDGQIRRDCQTVS